jgi:hypothetical protein
MDMPVMPPQSVKNPQVGILCNNQAAVLSGGHVTDVRSSALILEDDDDLTSIEEDSEVDPDVNSRIHAEDSGEARDSDEPHDSDEATDRTEHCITESDRFQQAAAIGQAQAVTGLNMQPQRQLKSTQDKQFVYNTFNVLLDHTMQNASLVSVQMNASNVLVQQLPM